MNIDASSRDALRETVTLAGIPETMLWPLWNRAAETRRANRLIDDPMAVDLVGRIDYDFEGSFGRPSVFHPIRARYCDDLIRSYFSKTESPVVIALGEGLETQFWRLAHERVRWFSVDLPESIAVRRQFLPRDQHMIEVESSALDFDWMNAVPAGAKPFISAAGLLMYFEETDVVRLLGAIGERFPGAEIFFDTITPHISARTLAGMKITRSYMAPPMPWGITVDALPSFVSKCPGLEAIAIKTYADPYPARTRLYRLMSHFGPARRRYAGSLVHARGSNSSER